MKITTFYSRLFQNTQQNASIDKKFSKFSSRELPHSQRVSKIFNFYIKNGNFLKFYIKNGI